MTTIIGVILIVIGSFNLYQYNKVEKENFYTKGTLIDYSYSPTVRKYFPIFRYSVDGITYEERYRGSYKNDEQVEELKNMNVDEIPKVARKFMKKIKEVNFTKYEIGKEYRLLVSKSNPKEYWIADDGINKGREYIWIGVGAIFLIVSFILKIIRTIF